MSAAALTALRRAQDARSISEEAFNWSGFYWVVAGGAVAALGTCTAHSWVFPMLSGVIALCSHRAYVAASAVAVALDEAVAAAADATTIATAPDSGADSGTDDD
jgi:hypothetical protein